MCEPVSVSHFKAFANVWAHVTIVAIDQFVIPHKWRMGRIHVFCVRIRNSGEQIVRTIPLICIHMPIELYDGVNLVALKWHRIGLLMAKSAQYAL